MSTWKAVVTEKGDALLAKMTQGRIMEITHAEIGAGKVDASLLKQQTSVSTVKQTATVEPVGYPEEGMCALPVTITNEGVAASFSAWQIGIFANDPDEGKILFFIAQAEDTATSIPSAALNSSYKTQVIFHVEYGAADSVTVDVNPANAVSQAGMENYVAGQIAGVTAESLGLGNVNNTSDTDKHVAYAQRAGEADKVENALTVRFNGGRTENTDMWTYDGSTSRTVNITPEKIGAAEAEHDHDAADVTSGTMALARLPLDELVNLHVWKRFSSEPKVTTTAETNVKIAAIDSSDADDFYSTDIVTGIAISFSGDKISVYESKRVSVKSIAEASRYLKSYIQTWKGDTYQLSTDATFSVVSGSFGTLTTYYLQVSAAKKMEAPTCMDMVASKNKDAYPTNGKHTDGYWYVYHKQLGE